MSKHKLKVEQQEQRIAELEKRIAVLESAVLRRPADRPAAMAWPTDPDGEPRRAASDPAFTDPLTGAVVPLSQHAAPGDIAHVIVDDRSVIDASDYSGREAASFHAGIFDGGF